MRARLSQYVRQLRGKSSLRDFSKRLGVSVGTVQAWEDAESIPDLENLFKIATIAGVSASDLFSYLNGGQLPEPCDTEQIASRIKMMSSEEFAVVVRAVGDRLVSVSEGN